MKLRSTLRRIGKFLSRPQVTLVVAFLLLFAGLCELGETVFEEFLGVEVRAAHGIMLFAISQIFISLTHILEGIEDFAIVAEAEEVKREVEDVAKMRREEQDPESPSE